MEVTSDTRFTEGGGAGTPHRRGVCRSCESADAAKTRRILDDAFRNWNPDAMPMPPVVDAVIGEDGGRTLAETYPESLGGTAGEVMI